MKLTKKGINMAKAGDLIIEAARAQAQGELAVHRANIEVYRTMPAGIGEHSDVTEAVIEELDKMAAAEDRLEMIKKYFDNDKSQLNG
tara:strand:+ start:538 stop:798 length:261 start_codon:yes stop_codon:yes gene_type:complete